METIARFLRLGTYTHQQGSVYNYDIISMTIHNRTIGKR